MHDLLARMATAARKRCITYAVCIVFAWPLATFFLAVYTTRHIPSYDLSLSQAALGVLGGLLLLGGDFLLVAAIALAASLLFFSALTALGLLKAEKSRQDYEIEIIASFIAVLFAAVLLYPAVLSDSLFYPLQKFPVWSIVALLGGLVAAAAAYRARPGKKSMVVASLLAAGFVFPGLTLLRNQMGPSVPAVPPVVFLGIDSISRADDVATLRDWFAANGGTWYTEAVSPGLLTNAVWPGILMQKPVRESGVFHTFQDPDRGGGHDLVHMARAQGYRTVSFFSDQFTCWVGSSFPFDENRSGPRGWRQLATGIVANNSILLPLCRPWLPAFPWTVVPPNHAGVYTYSIRRELDDIFAQSSPGGKTMVFGHTTYLHTPDYPNILDLPWSTYRRVLAAPLRNVQDRSFDWQDRTRPYDVIPLREWKVQHIQEALIAAVRETRFLERGGRLLLISDHGDRIGISPETFRDPRYWNVLFATCNLPSQPADTPLSSLDAGRILGLTNTPPFPPVVEYANGNALEWRALGRSAKISWDGSVHFDDTILAGIFRRLQSYRPQSTAFALRN
jgi:hypothetical protein